MLKDKYRECPFCGCTTLHLVQQFTNEEGWRIVCPNCRTHASLQATKEQARKAWNNRWAERDLERVRRAFRAAAEATDVYTGETNATMDGLPAEGESYALVPSPLWKALAFAFQEV